MGKFLVNLTNIIVNLCELCPLFTRGANLKSEEKLVHIRDLAPFIANNLCIRSLFENLHNLCTKPKIYSSAQSETQTLTPGKFPDSKKLTC